MSQHVKLFDVKQEDLDLEINKYVQKYKYDYYTFLTIVNTDIKYTESTNKFYFYDMVKALVTFEERNATSDEIKEIDKFKEWQEKETDKRIGYRVRKNIETGEILFYYKDKYWDLKETFDFKLIGDRFFMNCEPIIPSSSYFEFIRYFKCDYEKINRFLSENLFPDLKEITKQF